MECFFPLPTTAIPVEVPVLTQFTYDPNVTSFEDFPRSWTEFRHEFNRLSLQGLASREAAQFLQQWLFFGLLSEFLGCSIRTRDFSKQGREHESVLVVNTTFLHQELRRWLTTAQHQSDLRHRSTVELLRFAIHQSEQFDLAMIERYDQQLGAVSLSVKLLIELLTSVSNVALAPRTGILHSLSRCYLYCRRMVRDDGCGAFDIPNIEQPRVLSTATSGTPPLTPAVWLLLGAFTSNGWCKSQARQICQLYNYSTVNFLASIARDLPPSGSHDKCKGQTRCVAFNFDPESDGPYSTAHSLAHCQCRNLREVHYIGVEALGAIINRGGIPILYMDLDEPEPLICLTELNYWMRYFAISHVWSDGLGNEEQNGIRLCQAARIKEVLRKAESLRDGRSVFVKYENWGLQGGLLSNIRTLFTRKKPGHRIYFWLDTFCIPAGNEASTPEIKEIKVKALKQITPIFNGATAVIVLDSELQRIGYQYNLEHERMDDEKLAAHILATKWMQRAWTLEEGSLARKCFFAVGDNLQVLRQNSVNIDPLGRRIADYFYSRRERWRTHSPLDLAIARFRNGIPRIVEEILGEERKQALTMSSASQRREQLNKIRVKRFVHGWNNLLRRTTTKPNDMQTIFANILDFNSSSISRIHPNDGLVAILRSCQELPLSLLYCAGPRLQDADATEDAWLPISIDGLPLIDDGTLRRTSFGFRIVTTGVDPESFETWITTSKIPFTTVTFLIQDTETGHQYVAEKQINTLHDQGSAEFVQRMRDSGRIAAGTCIIMDKRGCNQSLEGYSARGVLFYVCDPVSRNSNLHVLYNATLQFRTLRQWQYQMAPAQSLDPEQMPPVSVQQLQDGQHVTLKLAPLKWNSPFPQRPLLVPRTNTFTLSQVIAVFGGLIVEQAVFDALYGERGKEDHEGTGFLLRTVVQVIFSTLLVRFLQYRSRRKYSNWLDTFDESWRPEERDWRENVRYNCRKWWTSLYRLLTRRERFGQIEL